MKGDTFTSTPRRRKKARVNRTREESTAGANNVTSNQTTLDESGISNQQNSRVIPVHTQHAASTTMTSTTSLFSQRTTLGGNNSRSSTERGVATAQVVFSTCQSLHPGQHIVNRAISSNNTMTEGIAPVAGFHPRSEVNTVTMVNTLLAAPTPHRSTQENAALGQNHTFHHIQQSNRAPPQAIPTNPHFNAVHTGSDSQQNVPLPALAATRDLLHSQGTSPLQYTGMAGGLPLPQ